jgi:hypothetical protein
MTGTAGDLDTALAWLNTVNVADKARYGTYTIRLGAPPTVPAYPAKIVLGGTSDAADNYRYIKNTALVIAAAGASFTLPLVADLWTLNDSDTVRYEGGVTLDFNGGNSVPVGYSSMVAISAAGKPFVYPSSALFARGTYIFGGWYDTATPSAVAEIPIINEVVTGSASLVSAGATVGTGKTLYAAWWGIVYTGTIREVIIPETGTYRLEVWGAQGGDSYNSSSGEWRFGGRGGYSHGELQLTAGRTLYVGVGEQGLQNGAASFNGGGKSGGNYSASGGGATHIALMDGPLKDLAAYKTTDVLIVAGGGGGSGTQSTSSGANTSKGGAGGGTSGLPGEGGKIGSSYDITGKGGTQAAGGAAGSGQAAYGYPDPGTFGQGSATPAATYPSWNSGGGGGFYGGGASAGESGYIAGAGGGSGYVKITGSAPLLSDEETIAGDTPFPAPGGGTETGHSGDGYARITKL